MTRSEVPGDIASLQAVFDASPVGIAVYDREYRFLAINRTLASVDGLSVEAHLGKRLRDVRPDAAALLEPILERVFTTGAPVLDVVLSSGEVNREKEDRHWIVNFVPLEFGDVTAVASYALNNTARHRAERARLTAEELFRQIAENIDAVLYLSSPDSYDVLYLNSAFERVWGISIESVRQDRRLWMQAIHPDDRHRVVQELEANRTQFAAEYRVVQPDGSVRWISDRSFPVYDESGTVVRIAGIATDETAAKQLEAQLLQSQRLESIGRLAGGLAHDFNNLLTVILSHATFAKQTPETAEEDLTAIEQAGERAADLTRQLLAFARRQVIEPRVMDVNALTINIDKLLRRLIGEDVELVTLLKPNLWPVKADPSQIEQVLVNLAVNARDAMPEGGRLTIETDNVVLDAAEASHHLGVTAGEYVMISVSDSGEGIDAATLPMIFEPFFSTKPNGQGTGLGLSTCYGIVKQAGGHIFVHSEPQHGASFKVYLPRIVGAVIGEAGVEPSDTPRGTETVLLVEDNESVRAIAARTLRDHGFRVLEAAHGAEALDVASRYLDVIHLLLTDVVMPHMGGQELATKLLALRPDVKVVYTSGYTYNVNLHIGMKSEEVDFIPKPYVPSTLVQRVRQALDVR